MRTNAYAFAGCILEGAPFLTPFEPTDATNPAGMGTEGLLRLFNDEPIALHHPDLLKLRAANPALSADFGRFDCIDISQVKAIFWTPVVDATFLYPLARCADRSIYPVHNGAIDAVLGTTSASMSLDTMRALWARMEEVTRQIPVRCVVCYPTDHLIISDWKKRIDWAQTVSAAFLSDWEVLAPEAELAEPGGYWAHYSRRAIDKMWREAETMLKRGS